MTMTRQAMRALFALDKVLDKFPQMRICQAIVNATNKLDPFYVTDDELTEALTTFLEQHHER